MSRENWNHIRQSKNFFVYLYRKTSRVLIFSLILNLLLSYLAVHLFLNRPQSTYFSTDGITPPVELTGMSTPNESSTPILGSEPKADTEVKEIPE